MVMHDLLLSSKFVNVSCPWVDKTSKSMVEAVKNALSRWSRFIHDFLILPARKRYMKYGHAEQRSKPHDQGSMKEDGVRTDILEEIACDYGGKDECHAESGLHHSELSSDHFLRA
jgi:hypothetical protein